MRSLTPLLLALAAGLWSPATRAEVKPHPLFTDHMVLQRGAQVPVWGTADPGEQVIVTLINPKPDGQIEGKVLLTTAHADAAGAWRVRLPALQVVQGQPGGQPLQLPTVQSGDALLLKIKGAKNEFEFKNVAVGDVWVCSGQSNMEWRLNQLPKDDQGKKVAAQATNPNLRLFVVPNRPAAYPQTDFPQTATEGRWLECKPETVINFSAVGYFFGRDVQKAQNVPVGLIASDWGGTSCQSWCSREVLAANPDLKYYVEQHDAAMKNYDPARADEAYKKAVENWKAAAEKAKADGKNPPPQPRKAGNPSSSPTTTTLYNGMIAPLLPFAIKGAIWYQGESNAGKAAEYYTLFPTMIADWRKRWGYEFPFLAVQLAPFRGGSSGVDYAELRDAQYQATRKLAKVGVAIITDAGDETDIHPQKKEPVGARLALAARAIAYGEMVEYRGPVYKSLSVSGNKGTVAFDHVGGGLVCKGDELHGFTVCGEDGTFRPAKAKIEGNTVVVTSDEVAKPVAVRFGWVNFAKPELNLFNRDGLPAVPFRTDNFPLTTAKK